MYQMLSLLWQSSSFCQSDTSFSGQWVSVSPKPTRDFIERNKKIHTVRDKIYMLCLVSPKMKGSSPKTGVSSSMKSKIIYRF